MDNKAVIYARVSSVGERQDTARQVADLTAYAAAAAVIAIGLMALSRGLRMGSKNEAANSSMAVMDLSEMKAEAPAAE